MKALCAAGFALLLGCSEPGSPPWGFDRVPERGFRMEMQDQTLIDDVEVDVERLADVRVRLEPASRDFELELVLDRFYLSVGGAPGGGTQLAVSPRAIVSRAADGTELRLGAGERTPSDRTVAELLAAPIGGTRVDSHGSTARASWHSSDPLLSDVEVLGWLLLGLPITAGDEDAAWTGSREVPRIGRYRLGIEMPLRFERRESAAERGRVIGVSGFVERSELTLADDFRGAIRLELEGESRIGEDGAVVGSRYLLRMQFDAVDGSVIRSRHRVTVECLECEGGGQISR